MFKSGREQHQGASTCVLEGDTLYVTPKRFALMQEAAMGLPINKTHLPTGDNATGSHRALKIAGLLDCEIELRKFRETQIVVDHELRD